MKINGRGRPTVPMNDTVFQQDVRDLVLQRTPLFIESPVVFLVPTLSSWSMSVPPVPETNLSRLRYSP